MRLYTPLLAGLVGIVGAPASQAVITYHTVDVPQAVGHGGNLIDGYIRANGSDSSLAAFGVPAAFANPHGALSTAFQFNLPFGQSPVSSYLSGTATWDNFEVSGNSVNIREFSLNANDVRTNQSSFHNTNTGAVNSLSASFDGRMFIDYTVDFEYTGSVPAWRDSHTEVDFTAAGGYVLNDESTGLRHATAAQFADLGGFAQGAADYLNLVVDNQLVPDNWTQAGLWLYSGHYTEDNTRGFFTSSLLGGDFIGYTVWYSTDEFVFGQPLPGDNGDGLFTPEAVQALIESGEFPDIGGLKLAGNGFAQLFDIHTIAGDGAAQTITIRYDDSVLAAGEEALLSIVHFTNGAWETPAQILDMQANTVTLTVNSFSPFALVSAAAVPLPPAAWLLGSSLLLLARRRVRRA